jgi:hypothetical protein
MIKKQLIVRKPNLFYPTHVGDALKELEKVSNQSSSSKLQESQDDKNN